MRLPSTTRAFVPDARTIVYDAHGFDFYDDDELIYHGDFHRRFYRRRHPRMAGK